jgi:hypothetical protein
VRALPPVDGHAAVEIGLRLVRRGGLRRWAETGQAQQRRDGA